MKSLALSSYKVKYEEAGTGQPILFLHNGGSGHWIWHYQIEHFAKNYRVLAFDMAGCGSSNRPNTTYNLDFYTNMADEILEKLKLKDLILIGNCVGASTALELAIRDSSKLKALVLFNLCGGPHMMTPLVRLASSPMPNFVEPAHITVLKMFRLIPGLIEPVVRKNYATRPSPNDPVFIAEVNEAKNPAQDQSRLNLINGLSSFNKFSHDFIRPSNLPPTLVFWGEKNRVMPLAKGLHFCKRLDPLETHVVKDAGHFLMAESPEYVNLKIDDFLLKYK